ncbi:MAG: inorganic diphosphatase [Sphingomonas sp.]|uniref:inorganic diphosphatase n=1 Tax=Sphingomonas sp. TaxID=28214 RepID=UPI001AC3B1BD|nr:inorganic diphosphatase [Sphingomonas sp.]MBN8808265.1 inorganic diphosphatase [Sphingomonas sp.]
MSDLTVLDPCIDAEALTCRAIIETPLGSHAKYDYDRESGLFELTGILPTGIVFPLAFGFVPSTLGGDGDPLDILLLVEDPLPIGCLVTAKLLGVIKAEQTEDGHTARNDRLIARVKESRLFASINELDQLGDAFSAEIQRFFEAYNEVKGKRFEVLERGDAAAAFVVLQEAHRQFHARS